ncbi:MAG: GFA family protein [Rhodoferax sp.]
MPVPPQGLSGQCQCGALRYRVQGQTATLFACHCTECQRQSGSAFGMALWVRRGQVVLERGALQTWVRALPSGRQMACRFCPQCGTRLFHQVLGQDEFMSIKPGTLDEGRALAPVGHIWTASKQPWVVLQEHSLQYPGNPPDFAALMDAWHAGQAPQPGG